MTHLRLITAPLLLALLAACGDGHPPALVPPLPEFDAGTDDASTDGSIDGEAPDAGNDGGPPLMGDRCTEHLSGISCQVEEIIGMSEWGETLFPPRFCARFLSGDVKCWALTVPRGTEPIRGDEMPFLELDAPALHIDGGHDQVCAWLENNMVRCENSGGEGPYKLSIAYDAPITAIAAGAASGDTWVMFGEPTVQLWRREFSRLPTSVPRTLPFTPVAMVSDLVGVFGDVFEVSCAITDAGDVRCWGDNEDGTLGVGDTDARSANESEVVPLGEPAVQLAAQDRRVCAVLESGALKCWGRAGYGLGRGEPNADANLGDEPNEVSRLTGIPLGTGRRARQVAMHRNTTCVVMDNGTLKCFGNNAGGVLGQPSTYQDIPNADDTFPPIQLGTGRRALQVAVAGDASAAFQACALLDDHSVKCWGDFMDDADAFGDALPRIDFGTMTRAEAYGFPPSVQVVTPMSAVGPQDAISGDSLTVTCDVQPDANTGDDVDPESVRIRLVDPADSTMALLEATAELVDGAYVGTLHGLSALPSRPYQVQCVASDDAPMPRTGRGSVTVLYDGGPNVNILVPASDGAIVGQLQPLALNMTILPGELGPGDANAAVDEYEVVLAGVVIDMTEGSVDGTYTASVDLLSSDFEPPPSGPIVLTVRARNERGIERVVVRELMVDDVGPVIMPTGVAVDGALVRGSETLRVSVTDAGAGVASGTVRAYVAGSTTPITLSLVGTLFEAEVDTSRSNTTQLPILLVAEDAVGNESNLPFTLRIDNVVPIVSLDPPPIREAKRGTDSLLICSDPFDPVGDDSVSDQTIAPEGAEFRARIEDQNPLDGDGVFASVAGIEPTSVFVYLLKDATRPILIDTDGDGVCDEINNDPDAVLRRRELEPATPSGSSYFPSSAANDMSEPAWDDSVCTHGAETTTPPRRCTSTSPLTRIIKASLPGPTSVPAIWGLATVDSLNCAGGYWDWRQQVPSGGGVCAAARAEDAVGNIGVSRALRVCLEFANGSGEDCNANRSWRTRDCMSGLYRGRMVTCTPPPDFEAGLVRADAY